MRRVVVTGVGMISPLGGTKDEFWQAICECRSAIAPLTTIRTEGLIVSIGAEIKGFDPSDHFEKAQLPQLDRFSQFALVAAREAIADSGLEFGDGLGARTATIIGTGAGAQNTLDDNYRRVYSEGAKRLHPLTIPRLMFNAPASHITMEHGLTGPAFAVASACSSTAHAVGQAFHMIRNGLADVAVTGGTEACITYGTMKGWEALRIMAIDTCRPFSKGRTGMVLGEGAGIYILEELEQARARGAEIYVEMAGLGMSSDAGNIVHPSADGAARAMRAALDDAGLEGSEVGYVNAHGTGTTANDITETAALHMVFGDHAAHLAVSSTKSMHGHALGAAAALELAATILAVRDGILPPTANYTERDPQCDLDYVPNEAREAVIEAALTNSFAFGGLNAVLAVRRFKG
ncbi:MAG: beta-ketoacyl-[acyl-carrier-protein] synthase family protein [Alphaproteobacteria bacterium]|nr:beta-ketoacyl-[acyl-carrier-protein] synthase family protein [Alphaproteobacteria bacterium]